MGAPIRAAKRSALEQQGPAFRSRLGETSSCQSCSCCMLSRSMVGEATAEMCLETRQRCASVVLHLPLQCVGPSRQVHCRQVYCNADKGKKISCAGFRWTNDRGQALSRGQVPWWYLYLLAGPGCEKETGKEKRQEVNSRCLPFRICRRDPLPEETQET